MYSATTEAQAIALISEEHIGSYVHCFGLSGSSFDVAVYDSEADFDADTEDDDNQRMVARYLIQVEEPIEA